MFYQRTKYTKHIYFYNIYNRRYNYSSLAPLFSLSLNNLSIIWFSPTFSITLLFAALNNYVWKNLVINITDFVILFLFSLYNNFYVIWPTSILVRGIHNIANIRLVFPRWKHKLFEILTFQRFLRNYRRLNFYFSIFQWFFLFEQTCWGCSISLSTSTRTPWVFDGFRSDMLLSVLLTLTVVCLFQVYRNLIKKHF